MLTNLVKPALDALFRWKEGQDKMEITRQQYDLMKKQLDADVQIRLAEEMRKPDSEFRNFILGYEGRSEDQTPFMRSFRSSVRPVITYWALIIITAVMFGWSEANLKENLNAIPDQLWQIFLAIFGFWFGGRALMQVAETWKKGETDKQKAEARGQVEMKRLDTMQAKADSPVTPANQPPPGFKFPWDDNVW